MNKTESRPLTLADIFLIVMEQMSKNERQKAHIRKVRTLMDVPEFAEYFHFLLMDTLGHPIPITYKTLDGAFECLSHLYEDNIDNNPNWNSEQKATQKTLMKDFMEKFQSQTKRSLAERNLLK